MISLLKNSLQKLSSGTMGWALFIVLSASFMRQVLNFLKLYISSNGISFLVWMAGAVPVGVLLITVLRIKNIAAFVWIGCLLSFTVLFALHMQLFEERVHIIKYGLLGFLLAKDLKLLLPLWRLIVPVLFGVAVACCDELFQAMLPYRVGDIRDVVFDGISVLLGVLLYRSMQKGDVLKTTYT